MRSRSDYIVTKDEVYGYAHHWLSTALQLECAGRKCTTSVLWRVLLLAAARVVSLGAICRDLANAPSHETVRSALHSTLPCVTELERRLNLALATELPKGLRRKPRMIAIDLTAVPYYGQPCSDPKELFRGKAKAGTTRFHAYATAIVVHKGQRFTLAVTRVEQNEKMHDVVQRLLQIVARQEIKIRFLLLDKAFFSFRVLHDLKQAGHGYIIPTALRGRKPKYKKKPTGLRAIARKATGYYIHRMTGQVGRVKQSIQLTICVSSKTYTYRKTGKRHYKKLPFAVYRVRRSPSQIRETYRLRFGIETSYRQMNQARSRTCSRSPAIRLLHFGIGLVLRNVWVLLHFKLNKAKWSDEPIEFQELLRFEQMLLWISQVSERAFGPDTCNGIERRRYEELAARKLGRV